MADHLDLPVWKVPNDAAPYVAAATAEEALCLRVAEQAGGQATIFDAVEAAG